MDSRQRSVVEAFRRTQEFLDHYDHLLGTVNQSLTRRNFDAVVARLDATTTEHATLGVHAVAGTAYKKSLREVVLIDHMEPIVSISRMLSGEHVKLSALEMPRARARDIEVAIAARALASVASQYRDAFVRAGLPGDFEEQLRKAANAFMASLQERDYARNHRYGLTRSVEYEIPEGWVVYRALRALVRKELRKHPELLAEFNRARLHRPRRALPAPRPALVAGETASVVGHALAPVSRPGEVAAPDDAQPPRQRISAWARIVRLIKPAA